MAPRRVPSSAGLPDNWTPDMDEFICYSDAVGDLSVKVTIISLKKRFPPLGPVSGRPDICPPQKTSPAPRVVHPGHLQ